MDLSRFDFMPLLLGYPMLLLALTVHECSHAWAADRFGDPTARYLGRITLNPIAHIDIFGTVLFPILAFLTGIPLIGWAKPVPVNPLHLRKPSRDNMFISLAGPLSNVLLGILLFAVLFVMRTLGVFQLFFQEGLQVDGSPLVRPLVLLLLNGMFINALLALFNMIPLPPLDGSHVVEHFLPHNLRHFWDQIKPFGFFLIMVLFYVGLLDYLIRPAYRILAYLLIFLV